jgi:hypothetical protein
MSERGRCWWAWRIREQRERKEEIGHCEHLTKAMTTSGVHCCICGKEVFKDELDDGDSGKQFARERREQNNLAGSGTAPDRS